MIGTIKSEVKKILTVRPTYGLMLFVLALMGLIIFYANGYRAQDRSFNSLFVAGALTNFGNIISLFGAFVGLLLLANEYRYNTIVYTLTASNSRTKVLVSKIIALLTIVLVFSVVATTIGIVFLLAGLKLGGHHIPHQDINYLLFYGKVLFFAEGMALVGLLFASIIRNQVGAIIALLLGPNLIEGLLTQLLKDNAQYLPFTALSQVLSPPVVAGTQSAHPSGMAFLSPSKGAIVFLVYLAIGWAVGWYLFLKRDAT